MHELLSGAFAQPGFASPLDVSLRLLASLAFGAAVAWIYARTTRGAPAPSLPTTLVLLAVLIAMVTQVVGDNVARAFSLVGALSIVRFRTVVRDTRDTAFVIFSVVLGMSAGAQNLLVGALGLLVVGAAAFAMAARDTVPEGADPPFRLTIRAAVGVDVEKLLESRVLKRQVISVSTAKQGTAIEAVYAVWLAPGASPQDTVKNIHRAEGVLEVGLNGQIPSEEKP